MDKDFFRGVIVSALLTLILTLSIGYGIFFCFNLNARLKGVENFLNNAIKTAQEQQRFQVTEGKPAAVTPTK